jgi:protein-S-isoprenylcysteine O-methyltransferase Ste14
METEKPKITKTRLFLTIIYILLFPAILLFLSGKWLWIEGWIFSIWFLALSYGAIFYLYRNDSSLLAERYRKPGTGGEKGWDKYFVIVLVILFMVWFIIMPLDAKRFMWTANFPLWLEVIGGIALIGSAYFLLHSYVDNTFLSPLVRIQKEREQKVVSTGVYGFIRHPMYLGGILLFI